MRKSLFQLFNVLTFLTLLVACDSQSNNSYTLEEYRSIGIPEPNSPWTALDYENCVNSLTDLKKRDFNSLPNLTDKNSEVLFKRMVNSKNFESISIFKMNLKASETNEIQSLGQSINSLLFIYIDQSKPQQKYHEELTEILVLTLKFSETLLNDFLGSPDIDSLSMNYKSGLKKVGMGYSNMLSGLLNMQVDTTSFSNLDLEKLSNEIVISASNYWEFVSIERRGELLDRINSLSEKGATELIKNNYAKLKNKFANNS